MVLDESETLPLLQGELASRSGRRATRRVLAAAAATLVALSVLYSATVPRAARPAAFPSKTNWTEVAIEKNREDEKRGAPLAGTSGLYGWTCKDCSAGTLWWSCDCQDKNQNYRGTSTVWKWTCQGTELTNKDGCLQCETYSPAWGAVSPILAGIAMSPTGDVCMAVPNPFDWTQQ